MNDQEIADLEALAKRLGYARRWVAESLGVDLSLAIRAIESLIRLERENAELRANLSTPLPEEVAETLVWLSDQIADYEDEDQEVGYPKRLREVQVMLESLARRVAELTEERGQSAFSR